MFLLIESMALTTCGPRWQGDKDADAICQWAIDVMQKWTPAEFGQLLHPPAPLQTSAAHPAPPTHPPYRRMGIAMFFNYLRWGNDTWYTTWVRDDLQRCLPFCEREPQWHGHNVV